MLAEYPEWIMNTDRLMTIGKLVDFARLIFWSELIDANNRRLSTTGINYSGRLERVSKG